MKKLSACILLSLFAFMDVAQADKFDPNHLFIKMRPRKKLIESQYISSSQYLINNIYLVKTTNISALSIQLQGQKSVEYIQKDYISEKSNGPRPQTLSQENFVHNKSLSYLDLLPFNDPMTSGLWAFSELNGMNVSGAYASLPPRIPEEIIVAVVDTGIDHTHEDLKDAMWINEKEIPGNKKDDDNNGYIDDIHGINTLIRDSDGSATMSTLNSGTPDTGEFHGTHVAGTIGATQNNGIGIAGVANNVKLMAIRTVPDEGDEKDSDIVEAFLYAAKNGAKIINCSFGKRLNEGGMVVRDIINAISDKVLVIAAAGNSYANIDAHPSYPASFDSENFLVVAASNKSGYKSSFSNFGKKNVDVAAPGSSILSTMPGNGYDRLDGTSMAAPHVSGVAAMVLGYFPELSPLILKKVIMDSVTPSGDFKEFTVTGGRVNLKNALEMAAKL